MEPRALPVITPIRPLLARELPRGRAWRYELKMDGFRGTLYLAAAAAFRSKTMRPMARFAPLAAGIRAELGASDAVLDGEIVVMGERGPLFNALLFHRGVPQFAAFDLLWLNGRDLRPRPYAERKAALQRLIRGRRWVSLIEHHTEAALLDVVTGMDLEGIVAKRCDEPYAPETRWVKVKNPHYSQGIGRWQFFRQSRDAHKIGV